VEALQAIIELTPTSSDISRDYLRLWSQDQSLVLDAAEALETGPGPLGGRLDLSRVALVGMSFGGTVALRTCSVDARCRAAVNLDGFSPLMAEFETIKVPSLHLESGEQFASTANRRALVASRSAAPAYVVHVPSAVHYSYTDLPLILPVHSTLAGLDRIPRRTMRALINDYVLAFLVANLEDSPRPFGEIPAYARVAKFSSATADD